MIETLYYLTDRIREDTRLIVIAVGVDGVNSEIFPHRIEKGVSFTEVGFEIYQYNRGSTRYVPATNLNFQVIHCLGVLSPILKQRCVFRKIGSGCVCPHIRTDEYYFVVKNLLKRMSFSR